MASHSEYPNNGTEEHGNNKFSYHARARDFVELHDQVQTSVNLLDSLESFLSTFQRDLSSVSGQISELQERSKDIDNRVKNRRRIEKPLSTLISDLTIPPALATTILDTEVGELWTPVIADFEKRLDALRARSRVKAARDLGDVVEGLRIVAAAKLRAFFLALLKPIKNSVTTNMQVLQSSVFLKYYALFGFLKRQAEPVAKEIQESYIVTARTYYETSFRRYIRSLGWLRARVSEEFETISTMSGQTNDIRIDHERLTYAKVEGPSVVLAYQADDKAHKEPLEAILRSLFLVLMDNATTEYSFVASFFSVEPLEPPPSAREPGSGRISATFLSPDRGMVDDKKSVPGSEARTHVPNLGVAGHTGLARLATMEKAERTELNNIWKKIFDPVFAYTKTFLGSVIEPPPPAIPLLTMARLTEAVTSEVQKRQCPPLETFFFTMRLQLWPVFQKVMSEHCEVLKKLAERPNGYFSKAPVTTDTTVLNICKRYIVMFESFVLLTEQAEETMIFSNLFRLQQELSKLILRHTEPITDPVAKATKLSSIYEVLLQGLIKGTHLTSHPKVQAELSYWTKKEEEARRNIISGGQRKQTTRQ
ncbi:Vps52-domain-containing protein [Paxillus ammoniavirescens]|nr:Vps52-domain-containing protein [Paxillus ammoniavirescens]